AKPAMRKTAASRKRASKRTKLMRSSPPCAVCVLNSCTASCASQSLRARQGTHQARGAGSCLLPQHEAPRELGVVRCDEHCLLGCSPAGFPVADARAAVEAAMAAEVPGGNTADA